MQKVQLANTYSPEKDYKVSSWFATPKFDGVRAVFIPEQGFYTRNGKAIMGLPDMAETLNSYCARRGCTFVDGELIARGGSFQDSQSVVMSARHPAKYLLEYHVFAVGGDFLSTQSMLLALPNQPEESIFRVNSMIIANTFEAVNEACRQYTERGYEGVVLRHPEVAYHEGRSNHLLKYKYFKEADLKIVGTEAGEGRLEGTLGALMVEGIIDGVNIKANVGTGMTDADRALLQADKNIVGKVLTVKYQAITDRSDKEGIYSLRFPSFAGIKQDR